MSAATLAPTKLTARVTSIVWAADDRTAVIARCADGTIVKGECDPATGLPTHLTYRFQGAWHAHEKFGRQFHFTTYSVLEPHDRKGVIAYLVSIVDGCGEKTAEKLWAAFGGEAVETLREQPARVAEAGVMSLENAEAAAKQLHDESAFEAVKIDLLGLFAGRGFQAARLIRECIAAWGQRAPEMVRRNPYILMVRGMTSAGFKRCDKLFLDRGGKPDKLKRQTLCAWHALKTEQSGHTWHREAFAVKAIGDAMPLGKARAAAAITLGVRAGWLARKVEEGQPGDRMAFRAWIAERGKARSEEAVARELARLERVGGSRP